MDPSPQDPGATASHKSSFDKRPLLIGAAAAIVAFLVVAGFAVLHDDNDAPADLSDNVPDIPAEEALGAASTLSPTPTSAEVRSVFGFPEGYDWTDPTPLNAMAVTARSSADKTTDTSTWALVLISQLVPAEALGSFRSAASSEYWTLSSEAAASVQVSTYGIAEATTVTGTLMSFTPTQKATDIGLTQLSVVVADATNELGTPVLIYESATRPFSGSPPTPGGEAFAFVKLLPQIDQVAYRTSDARISQASGVRTTRLESLFNVSADGRQTAIGAFLTMEGFDSVGPQEEQTTATEIPIALDSYSGYVSIANATRSDGQYAGAFVLETQ